MLKRTTIFILAAGLVASLAMAQGRSGRMGGARGPQFLAGYLGLTEEQAKQWEGIRRETQAKLEPLREEVRANRQALRAEMESGSPDANRIGERMLAGKALRDRMDQIRGESHARFESILTAEQKEKLAAHKSRRDARRSGRGQRGRGFN